MTDPVEVLRTGHASLEASYDVLREALEDVEAALLGHAGKVSAAIQLEREDATIELLSMRKVGDKWGLYVVTIRDGVEVHETPITRAPRRLRVIAAERIGELLVALIIAQRQAEAENLRAAELCRAFVAGLG